MSDFYINSISVDEKNGTFDATIETDFYQQLDDRYFLSNQIWEDLVYDREYDEKIIFKIFGMKLVPLMMIGGKIKFS